MAVEGIDNKLQNFSLFHNTYAALFTSYLFSLLSFNYLSSYILSCQLQIVS